MLAPIIHFLPLTTIVRKRMLPIDGRVSAWVGQILEPADIVADAVTGRKHLIVDIGQQLRVHPRQAAALTKVKRGQKVSQGELLAKSNGLFGREVKSPAEGRIAAVGGGKVILEMGGSPFELPASMPGVVSEIIPGRGVAIRSTGSVLQGVWGNGRIETGVMMSIMDHADEAFNPDRLDVSIRSAIILGGHVDQPDIFKIASDLPVRGLILASMSPALLPLAAEMDYPVMLIEGFGHRTLNSSAFKLLSTNDRRVITLNAVALNRFKGERPEVFIPLPVSKEPPEPVEIDTFLAGQTVRIISLSGPTLTGTITNPKPNVASLPNGLKVNAAEVKLESGEVLLAPLTNLEVLG